MKMEAQEKLPEIFDLFELRQSLKRRRRIVWAVTGTALLLGSLYGAVVSKKYTSTGTVEIKQAGPDSLGLVNALGVSDGTSPDSLLTNIEIQTQSNILESDSLALKVIDELHLEDSVDFRPRFSSDQKTESSTIPLRERPIRRDAILKAFEKNLKVDPTPGTRLIEISYKSKDPQTAKAVVNQLIVDLINSSSQSREAATSESSKFMDDQLAALRKRTETLQDQVAAMQKQAGIVSLGTTDTSGKQQAYSAILDELEQIGATLGQAQSARIIKGALYDEVRNTNPELISGLSGNLSAVTSPNLSTALNLIANLRAEETAEKANLAQMETKFGSGYVKLEESRMRVARFEQEIHDEVLRIRERAKNDYEIAAQTERDARAAYEKLKSQADFVNNSAMGFAIAKEEAESSRKLYEDLLSRSKQAQILQGLKPSDITVISLPLLPGKPSGLPPLIYPVAALVGGLLFGMGIALLADLTDGRVLSVKAVQTEYQKAGVSLLPLLDNQELSTIRRAADVSPNVAVFQLPQSAYAESLRELSNSLFLSRQAAAPQVVLITSAEDRVGKTMVSTNLAVVLAQQGKRLLLIDGDLSNPGVHQAFDIANTSGLTSLFTSRTADPLSQVRPVAAQAGLFVLPAGDRSAGPYVALDSPRLKQIFTDLRQHFDCILVDSAPLLTASDPILLAVQADSAVIVSRLGKTTSNNLRQSVTKLEQYLPAQNLRVALNGVGNGDISPAI